MNNLKTGDFVYFSTCNIGDEKLFKHSGMILNITNDIVSILNGAYSNTIYNLTLDDVRTYEDKENIINEINIYYDRQIKEYESKIKSVKRDFYKDEIVNSYKTLQQEIISTAKHMIEFKDDTDFENKLKVICEKKKQIFAIECNGVDEARKQNGLIKYKIRELESSRISDIKNLGKSIDNLKEALNRK